MTLVVGPVAVATLLLVVLVLLLRRRRRSTVEAPTAPDLAPDGREPQDQTAEETQSGDARCIRVLRAQVRTLEQALQEAEAAAPTVQHELERRTVPPTREAALQVVEKRPVAVATVVTEIVLPPPSQTVTDVRDSDMRVAALQALRSDSDAVLPVPASPSPQAARTSRWFRRPAA